MAARVTEVGAKVADTWGSEELIVWVNPTNTGMLVAVITFSMR